MSEHLNFVDGGNGVAAAGAVAVVVIVLKSLLSCTHVLFFYSYRIYFGHTVNELINC